MVTLTVVILIMITLSGTLAIIFRHSLPIGTDTWRQITKMKVKRDEILELFLLNYYVMPSLEEQINKKYTSTDPKQYEQNSCKLCLFRMARALSRVGCCAHGHATNTFSAGF